MLDLASWKKFRAKQAPSNRYGTLTTHLAVRKAGNYFTNIANWLEEILDLLRQRVRLPSPWLFCSWNLKSILTWEHQEKSRTLTCKVPLLLFREFTVTFRKVHKEKVLDHQQKGRVEAKDTWLRHRAQQRETERACWLKIQKLRCNHHHHHQKRRGDFRLHKVCIERELLHDYFTRVLNEGISAKRW